MASKPTRISSYVQVRWLDAPGLYPGNIRSRHMAVKLHPLITSNYNDRLIWRSKFTCNWCCVRRPPLKQEGMEAVGNAEEEMRDYAAHGQDAILYLEDGKSNTIAPARDRTVQICRAKLMVSSKNYMKLHKQIDITGKQA